MLFEGIMVFYPKKLYISSHVLENCNFGELGNFCLVEIQAL